MKIQIKKLQHGVDLPTPEYKSHGASGFDLMCAFEDGIVMEPGQRRVIPTGLAVAIPEGFELQVRPRSGLALKNGIMVVNSPGTVDSDYRGELMIILLNTDKFNSFIINRGDRIAQAVIAPVIRVEFEEVAELSNTLRGEGGFGSTGV